MNIFLLVILSILFFIFFFHFKKMEKKLFWFFVINFILQLLVIFMLILKTGVMLTRLSNALPVVEENVFLGIAISLLILSEVFTGIGIYSFRNVNMNSFNTINDPIINNQYSKTHVDEKEIL